MGVPESVGGDGYAPVRDHDVIKRPLDGDQLRTDQMPTESRRTLATEERARRYAMAEMTEPRIMVLSNVPL
jgi:hypothetical protein